MVRPSLAAAFAAVGGALTLSACSTSGQPDYMATTTQDAGPEQKLTGRDALDARIAHYARSHDMPKSLVHAAVKRESGYNPRLRHGPFFGLMQIRYVTARSMGYTGSPEGLLDAETNLKYAAPYLANAWLLADGDQRRALRLYASGYYYEAKRRGLLGQLRNAEVALEKSGEADAASLTRDDTRREPQPAP